MWELFRPRMFVLGRNSDPLRVHEILSLLESASNSIEQRKRELVFHADVSVTSSNAVFTASRYVTAVTCFLTLCLLILPLPSYTCTEKRVACRGALTIQKLAGGIIGTGISTS